MSQPMTRRRAALRLAVAALMACAAAHAGAQQTSGNQPAPVELAGTLLKVRDSGAITLAYRQSSIPFSFLSAHGEPIGYSIDLCRLLVDAIGNAIGRDVGIKWLPVTADSRIDAIASGSADLECGSTTSNLERRRVVSFSPTIFVAGTKLLVKKGAPIQSFRDLAGKRVVVTAGTTNAQAMREIVRKFKVGLDLREADDHMAAFQMLARDEADAFATDDVLLYGLLAQNRVQADYVVTGEYLSYEPYGIMYRKGDPQLARLVDDAIRELAESGELERRYERWFLRKLPSGVSLDLPMSPQLATIIETMASPGE